MVGEFSPKTFNQLFARRRIFFVNFQNQFEDAYGRVPALVVFVVLKQLQHHQRALVFADGLGDFALHKIEKINFLRDDQHELCPDFFYLIERFLIDKTQQRFFVIINRVFHVARFFAAVGENFRHLRFIVIKANKLLVNVPDFLIAVFAVALSQRPQREFICFILIENCLAQVHHNIAFAIVLKNADEIIQRDVVQRTFSERENSRNIKRDNAVFCMLQMFIADSFYFINAIFSFCFFHNCGKVNKIRFGIIADSRASPFFFIQHSLD